MAEPQIPVQDTASDPEDPEYFEQCIAEYEQRYEDYCESELTRYLNTPTALAIDALAEPGFGPYPVRKEDKNYEQE